MGLTRRAKSMKLFSRNNGLYSILLNKKILLQNNKQTIKDEEFWAVQDSN